MAVQHGGVGGHSVYPHEPGRLPGCPACDWNCHCNYEAVKAGQETECVWLGHESNERAESLSDEDIDEMTDLAAQSSYDIQMAWKRLEKAQKKRRRKNKKKASKDG